MKIQITFLTLLFISPFAMWLYYCVVRASYAFRVEGTKLLLLIVLCLPWVLDLALGYAYSSHPGQPRVAHTGVDIVMVGAMIANPILWGAAFVRFARVRSDVLPLIWFNILIAPFATLISMLSRAGASF